jgi:heme exporter protein D
VQSVWKSRCILDASHANPVYDDHPYNWKAYLLKLITMYLAEFESFLQQHRQIHDEHVHQQLVGEVRKRRMSLDPFELLKL